MQKMHLTNIRAVVFDAYGTLFDVNSAAAAEREALGTAGNHSPNCGAAGNCNTLGCAVSPDAMPTSGR